MFDLKELGKMVVQYGVPDKTLFSMTKEEIENLGKCFMEAKYINDTKQAKENDDIPF